MSINIDQPGEPDKECYSEMALLEFIFSIIRIGAGMV